MPDEVPVSPAVSHVEELGKGFREASDKIRARSDLAAKTLGGLATTALTAVGIAKFADVFPFHGGAAAVLFLVLLILSFLTMAAVIAFFTYRLWRLNRPLVMASEIENIDKLEPDEKPLVEEVYGQFKALNRVPSLRAYEARAHRLERIAGRSADDRAKWLRSRAALILVQVQTTWSRANVVVVRRRAARAIYGWWSVVAYLAFAIAVLTFGISADYLAAKRSDEVALAKSCAEAHGAGATTLPAACTDYVARDDLDQVALAKSCGEAQGAGATVLPDACSKYVIDQPVDEPATASSPRREAAAAIQELGAAWARCEMAAEERGLGADACAPIGRALRTSLDGG